MYRVRHVASAQGAEYDTPGQALRGMARAIRDLPLTLGERKTFEAWYTQATYRNAAQRLRSFTRYEIRLSVDGTRQAYVIEPLPHMPQDPLWRVILRAPNGAETPRMPPT